MAGKTRREGGREREEESLISKKGEGERETENWGGWRRGDKETKGDTRRRKRRWRRRLKEEREGGGR